LGVWWWKTLVWMGVEGEVLGVGVVERRVVGLGLVVVRVVGMVGDWNGVGCASGGVL
jgi:hypothetical protein